MFFKIGRKNLPITSTHQCFYLIYFLMYHTGCLGCKIKNEKELFYNKSYQIYGYIYRITYLTGLIGGFLYKICNAELNEAMTGQLPPVIKVILTFECILCPSTYVAVTIYMDLYRDEYVKFANSLQALDEEMHKHFPAIQWNYEKSRRKYNPMTVGMYGFYAIVSAIYVFYTANCMCGWISSILVSICYACVTGAPGFAGFLFVGNMDLLRLRFRLIRKLMQQFKLNLDKMEDISSFKLLEHFFTKYSSLITSINQVFCVISSSSLFHDFAVITSLGYLMCSKALDTKAKAYEYVFVGLFIAPRIYKVTTTALYGYATQKARQNCEREIIKIGYLLKRTSSLQEQTEAFLHWRMQNNYRITVGTILNCNLNLIYLVFNSVVNYIIILIQLQFQQNNIVKTFSNNSKL